MKNTINLILALLFATSISAETYTVFIHGKSSKNHDGVGTTDVNSYWGTNANAVSGAKIFIGYDGSTDPRTYGSARAQTNITTGLMSYCKGTNTCKVVCHSAGCYAIEYWLASLADTTTSKGFNITKVTALAAASGGSELANVIGGGGNAMDQSLQVTTARGAYNHNLTASVTINHVPGYKSKFGANFILPGADDYAVAFHSSCGYNRAGGLDKCQSSFVSGNTTYTQYSGHVRAPSLTAAGLNKNHSEIMNEGAR
ncbi:hypothetical protein EHR04_13030 [Leptospira levettii]|uniref:Lipase n=1 Tax=Leptospira levettii TaxID=2023178 RepID=A0A5R2BHC8_9LEPT|nr:hypothetical protein [Leptospira levettii]MCG6147669.1 hypothetical protein [Leptospira levettii]MCW7465050.1 hypothetical protein [Leptospira levettii]MCW7498495.1 hypothetical protein [Leptospira levettii]MCW7507735.1 hypothetical protein [Leptospira levettii]MCW7509790.1 hypothetical protein [Leptospira levettii]